MWPKHKKGHLISRNQLSRLKSSCVIVDISCDTNGAIETCRPTTWQNPTYKVDGITHFYVDNLLAAVPVTASYGNGYANLNKIISIAEKGVVQAVIEDDWLARGLTCYNGKLILEEAGVFQQREYVKIHDWIDKYRNKIN